MQSALIFLFKTLADLYLLTFLLRFIMQWVRASHYNPLSQFVFKVTNPLVVPARRVLPSVAGLDTPTLVSELVPPAAHWAQLTDENLPEEPILKKFIGGQALAVTLRGLFLGDLQPGRKKALVAKEALLGLVLQLFLQQVLLS